MDNNRLKIFTWHVHGSYLFYLSQGNYDLFIPVNEKKTSGYTGRGETFPFGPNVIEVPVQQVREMEFDLILFQEDDNYFTHQFEVLSDEQRCLPKIYIEHDPPWGHPTNEYHPVVSEDTMVVHVTHFNRLMWNNHNLRVKVIPHGVNVPKCAFKGTNARGIVIINNLPKRGRLLGFDIFEEISKEIPLDLVGMGSEEYGIGEVLHPQVPEFISQYRFFFNPIRYTSLGLAVCEAMMLGIPVVGLATTEMPSIIKNEVSGFVHNDLGYLKSKMKMLLSDIDFAKGIGLQGKKVAEELFDITRFNRDWERTFYECIGERVKI
jgi:glycosyltransferase involved in cell wall biosynthesis